MATPNTTNNIDKIIQEAKTNYDYIRFTFVDIHGITRCKVYPRRKFESVLRDGYGVFCGTLGIGLDGNPKVMPPSMFERCNNDLCKPVLNTLHPLPLHGEGKYRVGQVFCDVYKYGEDQPRPESPRSILQRQLDQLEELGYLLYSAWEIEYTVVDEETSTPKFTSPTYCLSGLATDMYDMSFFKADSVLEKMGVKLEAFSVECGSGQIEISLIPEVGMRQADNLMMIKDTLKYLHSKNGEKAIFMTKPLKGLFSNGFHFNHSLLETGTKRNVFYDSGSEQSLSSTFRNWMGGILKHSPAITALACPTVNCYRRLHNPGVPTKANWGIDDRMAAFRVKNLSESESYIEARLPSGSINSYLTMAAFVAAGLDGLKNKYDLDEPRGAEKVEPQAFPKTLDEALDALEKDSYMVEVLGEDFVKWFTSIKRAETKSKLLRDFNRKMEDEESLENERKFYMEFV